MHRLTQEQSNLETLQLRLNDESSFVKKDDLSLLKKGVQYFDGYNIYELKSSSSSPDQLTRQGEPIAKLRLLQPNPNNKKASELPLLLYIRYVNGAREIIEIEQKSQEDFLCSINQKSIYAFARSVEKMRDWTNGINRLYSQDIRNYYKEGAAYIKKDIMAQKARCFDIKKMNIIDLGCGDGTFIVDCLLAEMPFIQWIGVDLSDVNIRNAQKKIQQLAVTNPELKKEAKRFICGNMLDIISIFEQAKKNELLDPDAPTIITALGSITRFVLPNGFVAARVFQELYSIKNLFAIIGCGLGEPLITPHIAKRIGFELLRLPVLKNNAHYRFSMDRLEKEDILYNKVNKIKKSNILDLSLSPVPHIWLSHPEVIQAAQEKKERLTIDISYCEITDIMLNALKNMIENLPKRKVQLIFSHVDTSQIERLGYYCEEHLMDYQTSLTEEHVDPADDIRLTAPKAFFDTFQSQNKMEGQLKKMGSLIERSTFFKDEKDEKYIEILQEINTLFSIYKAPWHAVKRQCISPATRNIIYGFYELKRLGIDLTAQYYNALCVCNNNAERMIGAIKSMKEAKHPKADIFYNYFIQFPEEIENIKVYASIWIQLHEKK
jgi:SAM-dependent methyltransferase